MRDFNNKLLIVNVVESYKVAYKEYLFLNEDQKMTFQEYFENDIENNDNDYSAEEIEELRQEIK